VKIVQSERVASPPEADKCGGRKGGLVFALPPARNFSEYTFKFVLSLFLILIFRYNKSNKTTLKSYVKRYCDFWRTVCGKSACTVQLGVSVNKFNFEIYYEKIYK